MPVPLIDGALCSHFAPLTQGFASGNEPIYIYRFDEYACQPVLGPPVVFTPLAARIKNPKALAWLVPLLLRGTRLAQAARPPESWHVDGQLSTPELLTELESVLMDWWANVADIEVTAREECTILNRFFRGNNTTNLPWYGRQDGLLFCASVGNMGRKFFCHVLGCYYAGFRRLQLCTEHAAPEPAVSSKEEL